MASLKPQVHRQWFYIEKSYTPNSEPSMSWLNDKTGRPKEQGGHKRINVTVEKFVSDALQKVPNKSQFLEKVARPVLEQLDPGEASVYVWKIEMFISQGIIKATQEGNFKQAQALGWLADQLEDARALCGMPPSNLEFSALKSTEESQEDKARALTILRSIPGLIGPLSTEELTYFYQNDGKPQLDKAKALLRKKGTEALGC